MEESVKFMSSIQELEDFYISNDQSLKMVALEDSRFKKSNSDELKGQWAIEQFEAAAEVLMLTKFISKKGGSNIPEIEGVGIYVEHALQEKAGKIEQLDAVIPNKKARFQLLTEKCGELFRLRESLKSDYAVKAKVMSPESSQYKGKAKKEKVQPQAQEGLREGEQWHMMKK